MNFILLLGRILYSAIFIVASPNHFTGALIGAAESHHVPMAAWLVPASGLLALIGGISVLIGFKARWGAWLLVIFLVPVTLVMHKFWGLADPGAAQLQQIMFLKNLSMLGGAFLIAYFGAGPISVDRN